MEFLIEMLTGLIVTAVCVVGFILSITKKDKGFYGGAEDDQK